MTEGGLLVDVARPGPLTVEAASRSLALPPSALTEQPAVRRMLLLCQQRSGIARWHYINLVPEEQGADVEF